MPPFFYVSIVCMVIAALCLTAGVVLITLHHSESFKMAESCSTGGDLASSKCDAYNEIVERNKYYLQLHRERRYDELYEFYTEDCRYMAQGKELIIGKTAFRASGIKEAFVQLGVDTLELITQEVVDLGDTAMERGEYGLVLPGGEDFDRGKYLVMWKKLSGVWMMHMEIFNTNIRR